MSLDVEEKRIDIDQKYPDIGDLIDDDELLQYVGDLYAEFLVVMSKLHNKKTYVSENWAENFKNEASKVGRKNLIELRDGLSKHLSIRKKELEDKIKKEQKEAMLSLYHNHLEGFGFEASLFSALSEEQNLTSQTQNDVLTFDADDSLLRR